LLFFGDLLLDFSIQRMIEMHKKSNAIVTLFAHPNSHPYDSDMLIVNARSQVVGYYSKQEKHHCIFRNLVNAGIYIISPKIFSLLSNNNIMDLEKDIIFPLCNKFNNVFAYRSSEYVKDIGTPERLLFAECDMKMGIIEKRNLDSQQYCIFLDNLKLEKNIIEAIKKINSSRYICIVISAEHGLESLLGKYGAYIDEIFYCHSYKQNKKMLKKCLERFNISLNESFIIIDSNTNSQNEKNAKKGKILVKKSPAILNIKHDFQPDYICVDVYEAIQSILGG
jgi:histidinol phosphatase-like enzyme